MWLGAQPKTKANKNSEWKWLTGEPIPNEAPFKWTSVTYKTYGPGALLLGIKSSTGFDATTETSSYQYLCEVDEV